jgi:hypothetical protein
VSSVKMKVCFLDCNKKVIFEKRVIDIPLKEKTIISKSIEWFSDPEPCMIHRSAVMKRLYFELIEYFESQKNNGNSLLALETIPAPLLDMLDIDENVSFFAI